VTDSFAQRGFRVSWIDWDSDFRNSGLQIEDMIVGYDNVSLEQFLEPGKHASAIGQYGETTYWQELGARHGHTITLTVFRQGAEEPLKISGRLLARRFYYDLQEKSSLGPGGPPKMASDGFSGSWGGWYEKLVSKMSYILDGGWNYKKINSKKELQEHKDHKKRIDYIMEHYPGDFADTVLCDWQRVYINLQGKELNDVNLEYREIGAKRVQTVMQEAESAWEGMRESLKGHIISPFPAAGIDDRESVKGKAVVMPWITPRNIINDLGQTYAVFGNRTEGFYFAQLSDSLSARRFYDEMHRYQSQVSPKLKERYQFIGRITGEPALITYDGNAATGLLIEIIAARAGDGEFFVDLQGSGKFAGQEKIAQFFPTEIGDDALPQRVIEAMIDAVKMADQKTWQGLFATWRAYRYWGEHVAFDPSYAPSGLLPSAWEQSRRLITDSVYDVRIDKTGPIRRIIKKDGGMGWPDVDEVDVFVDHYGLEDGKYRSFLDVNVRRRWTLQRLDGGPWRIITVQPI